MVSCAAYQGLSAPFLKAVLCLPPERFDFCVLILYKDILLFKHILDFFWLNDVPNCPPKSQEKKAPTATATPSAKVIGPPIAETRAVTPAVPPVKEIPKADKALTPFATITYPPRFPNVAAPSTKSTKGTKPR